MNSSKETALADHLVPAGEDELVVIRLRGDESVDLVLNTSWSDFRAKIFAGQTVALGRKTAEDLVEQDPETWEVVPKSKDRR